MKALLERKKENKEDGNAEGGKEWML